MCKKASLAVAEVPRLDCPHSQQSTTSCSTGPSFKQCCTPKPQEAGGWNNATHRGSHRKAVLWWPLHSKYNSSLLNFLPDFTKDRTQLQLGHTTTHQASSAGSFP